MSYDTLYFAVFLAAVWLAFDLLPGRGWTLLVGSIVFYSVAGLRDSLLATAIIIINFLFQFPILRDSRLAGRRHDRLSRRQPRPGIHREDPEAWFTATGLASKDPRR